MSESGVWQLCGQDINETPMKWPPGGNNIVKQQIKTYRPTSISEVKICFYIDKPVVNSFFENFVFAAQTLNYMVEKMQ